MGHQVKGLRAYFLATAILSLVAAGGCSGSTGTAQANSQSPTTSNGKPETTEAAAGQAGAEAPAPDAHPDAPPQPSDSDRGDSDRGDSDQGDPQPGASKTQTTKPGLAMAPANSWNMFRGNSLSTGVSAASLATNLDVLWKVELGEGGFDGAAAIENGVVYIADLYGVLYALKLSDGEQLWKFTAGEVSGFVASPAVRDGRVYIGDIDGFVYCLDAKSGEKLWQFETNAEIDSCANFYKDSVLIGSQDATLYRIDCKSGKEVWKYEIEDQIRCTPTIVENFAFVGGCDGRLHVIDIELGKAVRSVELGSQTGVTPAVDGDYAFLGTNAGEFLGVHWREGEVVWRYADEAGGQQIMSSPAVRDNLVIYGGRDKRLHALDAKTGEEVWAFATKGPIDGSPVIAGEHVYIGAADGRLYRVNLKDGKSDWNRQLRGKVKTASPAIADGCLVIGTDAAFVYCIGEKK